MGGPQGRGKHGLHATQLWRYAMHYGLMERGDLTWPGTQGPQVEGLQGLVQGPGARGSCEGSFSFAQGRGKGLLASQEGLQGPQLGGPGKVLLFLRPWLD